MHHPVLTLKFRFNRIIVECDMIVVATGPVASVGVNNWYHFSMIEIRASSPKCVAQVTNHRTISLRRQFRQVNVIRITCRPSSKATDNRILLRELASVVAYRKASWANWKVKSYFISNEFFPLLILQLLTLNKCDEL